MKERGARNDNAATQSRRRMWREDIFCDWAGCDRIVKNKITTWVRGNVAKSRPNQRLESQKQNSSLFGQPVIEFSGVLRGFKQSAVPAVTSHFSREPGPVTLEMFTSG
jgi:hypothetical protein